MTSTSNSIILLAVAIHAHLLEGLSPTPKLLLKMEWVPLFGFIIVTSCHPIFTGVIVVLIGELFPTDIRTVSIGIVRALQYLVLASATKMFPILSECLHSYGLNYYYAATSLLFTIWGMVTIKDVDQLSLVEIERIYDSRVTKSMRATQEKLSKDENYGSFEN